MKFRKEHFKRIDLDSDHHYYSFTAPCIEVCLELCAGGFDVCLYEDGVQLEKKCTNLPGYLESIEGLFGDRRDEDWNKALAIAEGLLEKYIKDRDPKIWEQLARQPPGRFEMGITLIKEGRCPAHATGPMACWLCPYGHATECHYPQTCEQARCSHCDATDQESGYSDHDRLILGKGTCCICSQPLATSKYVNIGMLNKRATWKDPSWGNVLVEGSGGRAVFFVCDGCQEISEKGGDPGPVKFALEVKDGQVILHPVEELEDVPAITPDMVDGG